MINKKLIKKTFSKAASNYDKLAHLQNKWADYLIQSCCSVSKNGIPEKFRLLDIGSGTGNVCFKLGKLFPESEITGCDIADGMLSYANQKKNKLNLKNVEFVEMDAESLKFKPKTFDLIVSNFSLQWVADFRKVLSDVYSLLKNKAYFCFTTLGSKTLLELRYSVNTVYKNNNRENIPGTSYYTITEIRDMLVKSKFKVNIFKSKLDVLQFSQVMDFFKWMKYTGAINILENRSESIAKRKILSEIISIYDKTYRENRVIPATFEVVFCVAAKN